MMTNSLRQSIGAVLCLGLVFLLSDSTFGQNRPRSAPPQQPGRAARNPNPAQAELPTPAPAPKQAEADPQLEAFLQSWEKYTKNINSLEGRHTRFTYDFTWKVEKRAVGAFYYEAPDKGRIDLLPDNRIDEGETKVVDKITFKVQPADPEMWISNGNDIVQVNVKDKTYSRMPLPAQLRGQNIMDGPLPFLFGMPAEVAKSRYDMTLKQVDAKKQTVLIEVRPLWQSDAANYSKAYLIISTVTYLPQAVKLIHPGGNEHTVYTFGEIDINKKPKIFEFVLGKKDPFNPSLRGYKEMQNQNAELNAQQQQENGPIQPVGGERVQEQSKPQFKPGTVPDLSGMPHTKIEQLLEGLGYGVKFYKGNPAKFKEQVFTAYNQIPKPGEPLKPGEVVKVQLYNEQAPTGN